MNGDGVAEMEDRGAVIEDRCAVVIKDSGDVIEDRGAMIEDRGATIEDRGAVAFLSTTAFHSLGLCGRRNDKRTSCSSPCLYVIIRIVFLLSHFFSVISVHDRRNDTNSAAIGGYIARAGNTNRDTSSAEPQYPGLASCAVRHCR